MQCYCITIKPVSAFGTPLVGDTLFGQLCWAIRHRFGEQRLVNLLADYSEQNPFLVVSDAFPKNYIPLPTVPSQYWDTDVGLDRKQLKKKKWLSINYLSMPFNKWQQYAESEQDIYGYVLSQIKEQPHNSINRQTNTTGKGMFAPYTMPQIWYIENVSFDIYCLVDESRLTRDELQQVLEDIGVSGYGRDASIGLGKFVIEKINVYQWKIIEGANAYLTLAYSAPQGLTLNTNRCFYQIGTKFGRHGDLMAITGNPFKKPIILAKTGAIFTPNVWQHRDFLGNGLANISYTQTKAVHQGYAPVISINIPELKN